MTEPDFSDYSAEEQAELRAAGVMPDLPPWEPTTPEDVDSLCWRRECILREAATLEAQAAVRAKALRERAQHIADAYGERIREIVAANLRGKSRSLDLEHGRVSLRRVPGGPRIVDPEALVRVLLAGVPRNYDERLAEALSVSRTESLAGHRAVAALAEDLEEWRVKWDAVAVKAYVAALPPVPDPETGEARAQTIPGVEIVEDVDTWTFRAGGEK